MAGVDLKTLKMVNAGLHCGSFLMLAAGFSMSYWSWSGTTHYGLWRLCVVDGDCEITALNVTTNFGAIQLMMCGGVVFHFISLILHFSWSCQSRSKGVSSVAMAAFAFSIMAATATLTSVLAFINMQVTDSYHLCVFLVAYSGLISAFGPIISLTAQCMMGAPPHGVAPAKP